MTHPLRLIVPALGIALLAPLAANAYSPYHKATASPSPAYGGERSRAEVVAEVQQARRDGTLERIQRNLPPTPRFKAEPRTRQQVVDEMRNEPAEAREARQFLMIGG